MKIYKIQKQIKTTSVNNPTKRHNEFKEEAPDWMSKVTKINLDLYTAKVNDKFYLAMERINDKNIDMWCRYATLQDVAVAHIAPIGKFLPGGEGSSHFKLVLNNYKNETINPYWNALWVAYVSSVPVTSRAYLDIYSDKEIKNPNIEMYITVITSRDALLTSHMGISRSYENALDLDARPPRKIKQKDQALQLHSFAAKVMKLIDPKKIYMLTTPTGAMRSILMTKLPSNSIFIGDSEYKMEVENAVLNPRTLLHEWDLKEKPNESKEKREERLMEKINYSYYKYDNVDEKKEWLATNPPRIIKEKKKYTIQSIDGTKDLVTFDENTNIYQWLYTDAYRDAGIRIPYVLIDLDQLAGAAPIATPLL